MRVRDAIRMGIDYETVIDATVAGNGEKQSTGIPNGFEGSADLPLPEQDVEGARALLEEAGVSDLTLDAAYPSVNVYGVDFDTMMAKVQQDLAAVGIQLELEPLEFAQWVERITGDGIPVGDLPKVFTKFFRRDHGRPTGTGLGLWISRGLVEAHGGELTATSEPGEGATFTFTLPTDAFEREHGEG